MRQGSSCRRRPSILERHPVACDLQRRAVQISNREDVDWKAPKEGRSSTFASRSIVSGELIALVLAAALTLATLAGPTALIRLFPIVVFVSDCWP